MSMDWKVQGKNAIVTGAAGNIGRACVTCLAEAGANVMLADMDPAAAEQAVKELHERLPRPVTLPIRPVSMRWWKLP